MKFRKSHLVTGCLFIPVIIASLVCSSCVSYDLPEHHFCLVKDATFDVWGDIEQEITETTGNWVSMPEGAYRDLIIPYILVESDSRDRRDCIKKGGVPVVFEVNSVETEHCADSSKLPNGCDLKQISPPKANSI